ncbi:MAG: response regulator [Bdellovibrionia bacterium]
MANKLILLVEDDEGIRDVLKLALEMKNYTVATASNGQEALDLLKSSALPNLILLDLMMPLMDGWTFAEITGQTAELRAIPIIIVSAYVNQVRHPKEYALARAAANLVKPPTLKKLLQTVKECMG